MLKMNKFGKKYTFVVDGLLQIIYCVIGCFYITQKI